MAPLLEVRGICKRFGATVALADVSSTFQSGSIHCVLGENGAGKSTLGKIIGGVYHMDAGHLMMDGEEIHVGSVAQARKLGIAAVFQELSLAPDLAVRANLQLGSESHSHPFSLLHREAERKRVVDVLERLDIRVDPEARVGALPIATRQLLEVAKALIRNPRLIILDEPTAMLNEGEKRVLYTALAALRAEGKALVLITHHLEDVEAVADHVTIMRDGRLLESFAVTRGQDFSSIAEKLGGRRSRVAGLGDKPASEAFPFLEIRGLSDRAGKPVPLTLRRGEILGLYGMIGCGAERITATLVGLRGFAHLELLLDGERLAPVAPYQARARGIAYLPTGRAGNGIFPTRSIRENLNISLLRRYSRAGVVSRRTEADATRRYLRASVVKYSDDSDDITQLSGGNQQKILVARVLAAAARAVVLEDPTAGVDIGAKRQILDAIRARAAEGVAVVLVSSDLEETIELVDTLYTLYSGAVVARYVAPQLLDKSAIVADVIGRGAEAYMQVSQPRRGDSSLQPSSNLD